MPGVGALPLAGPLTISIDHTDLKATVRHQDGLGAIPAPDLRPNLTPDWRETGNIAPWWRQPALKPGQVTTVRRKMEPGQVYKATDAYRASLPMTPSMDARDLPSSWTSRPLLQFPRRNYPGSFPHKWIPYEKMYAATGPDRPPRPPGWAPIPPYAGEEERAISAALPLPWADEQNMAHDISGFGDLASAMGSGLGQTPAATAREAFIKECMAKGMPRSTCEGEWDRGGTTQQPWYTQAIGFASQAYQLYAQEQALDAAKKAEERRQRLEAARLANERAALAAAAAQTMPSAVAAEFRPPAAAPSFGTYAVVGLGALALIGGGIFAFKGRAAPRARPRRRYRR